MNDDTRSFPIQGDCIYRNSKGRLVRAEKSTIPWWLAEVAYKYYSAKYGKDQSIERLAKRGGFGRGELLLFLRGGKS